MVSWIAVITAIHWIPLAVTLGLLLPGRTAGLVIHRPSREPLEQLRPLLEAGTIVPVIDRTYALEDTRRAFERFGSGDVRGKVVIAHAAP